MSFVQYSWLVSKYASSSCTLVETHVPDKNTSWFYKKMHDLLWTYIFSCVENYMSNSKQLIAMFYISNQTSSEQTLENLKSILFLFRLLSATNRYLLQWNSLLLQWNSKKLFQQTLSLLYIYATWVLTTCGAIPH